MNTGFQNRIKKRLKGLILGTTLPTGPISISFDAMSFESCGKRRIKLFSKGCRSGEQCLCSAPMKLSLEECTEMEQEIADEQVFLVKPQALLTEEQEANDILGYQNNTLPSLAPCANLQNSPNQILSKNTGVVKTTPQPKPKWERKRLTSTSSSLDT
ncbi:hypothetical protein GH733_002757 [Mirounga leonina]|nr:hypothetical protein GH733_002757 [Mirounga leonina]